MVWDEPGRNEEYVGQWSNNKAHGQGVHTWHVIRDAEVDLDRHCSQQMNNRYDGEWFQGMRHGYGVFYYANGSIYKGRWHNDLKQDTKGRYTFEDGSVYFGLFEADQMVNYARKVAKTTTINLLRTQLTIESNSLYSKI